MTSEDRYGTGTVIQNSPGSSWSNLNNALTNNGVCAICYVPFPPVNTETLEMTISNFTLNNIDTLDSVQGAIEVAVNTSGNPYTVRIYLNDGSGWCSGHVISSVSSYGTCNGGLHYVTCNHFSWTEAKLKSNTLKIRGKIEGAAGNVYVDAMHIRANYTEVYIPPPSTPSAPSLTADCTSIGITSTEPSANSGSLSKWQYQLDTSSGFNSGNLVTSAEITTDNDGSNHTSHSALASSTTHYCRVRYKNTATANWSNWSSASSILSDGVPSKPANPVVTSEPDDINSGKSQVTVRQGTAPSFNGCTTSESYNSQIAPDSSGSPGAFGDTQTDTTIGSTRTVEHDNLTPGGVYWIRHRFNNAVGSSAWSNYVSITVDNVPNTPAAPTLTNSKDTNSNPDDPLVIVTKPPTPGGNGDTTVYWEVQRAPDNNGSPGTWSTISGLMSVNVTTFYSYGVARKTKYYYRTRFKNGVGYSAYGASASIITFDAPDTPAPPTRSSADKASITFQWTTPETNGSTIQKYRYKWKKHNGTFATVDTNSTALSATKTGLSAGTRYYFEIQAVSDMGDSGFSTDGIMYTLPSKVTSPVASAVDNQAGKIIISWDAYVFDTDETLTTAYRVYVADSPGGSYSVLVSSQTGTSYIHTGLGNGVTKYYKIVVINPNNGDVGAISEATEVSATTINNPSSPGTPTFSSATVSSISFAWTASTNDGGNEPDDTTILEYHYQWKKNGGSFITIDTNSTALSATKSSLVQNTKYYFQVLAVNTALLQSSYSSAGAMYTQPDAPTNPTAEGQPGQILITWNSVAIDTDDATQTVYDIDVSDNGTSWNSLVTNLTSLSYIHTGLGNGVTKYYRIRARNPSLASANTTTISATSDVVPSAPTAPSVTVPDETSGTLRVTRPNLPSDGGDTITHWRIESSDDNGATDPYSIHTTDIAVGTTYVDITTDHNSTSLGDGKQQYYKVSFKNGVGYGSYGDAGQNTTPEVPGIPSAPNLSTPSYNTIVIDRPSLTANNREDIDTWTIRRAKGVGGTFTDLITLPVSTTSYTNFPLESGTWRYEVYFTNAVGNSPVSGISIANSTPQSFTKYSNAVIKVVDNSKTKPSNSRVKNIQLIDKLSDIRIKALEEFTSILSNSRVKIAGVSLTTLSNTRIKSVEEITQLSDIRIKTVNNLRDKISYVRLVKSFSTSLLSNTRIKKQLEVLSLGNTRIKKQLSYTLLGDTRVKILNQNISLSSFTNIAQYGIQINENSNSRILILGNIINETSDSKIIQVNAKTKQSDTRIKVQNNLLQSNSDVRIKNILNSILKTSDTRLKKLSSVLTTSDIRVLIPDKFVLKTSDTKIIHIVDISLASGTTIKVQNNNFTNLSDTRMQKNQSQAIVSDTHIKATISKTKLAQSRIKFLSQEEITVTNSRIKALGQDYTRSSNTRVKITDQSFSNISDARVVVVEQNVLKTSTASIVKVQTFITLSGSRIIKTNTDRLFLSRVRITVDELSLVLGSDTRIKQTEVFINTLSDAKIFLERNIIKLSNTNIKATIDLQKVSDANITKTITSDYLSNTRIKSLENTTVYLSDTRVSKEQFVNLFGQTTIRILDNSYSLSSDTRIRIGMNYTLLANTAIVATQSKSKQSNSRIKELDNVLSTLSNSAIKVSENEILVLSNANIQGTGLSNIRISNSRVKKLNSSILENSNAKIKLVNDISTIASTRVKILGSLFSVISNTRIELLETLFTEQSDARIKSNMFYNLFSSANIKVLDNSLSTLSSSEVVVIQESSLVSDTRVTKTIQILTNSLSRIKKPEVSFTALSKARVFIERAETTVSDTRIKNTLNAITLSDTRIQTVFARIKISDARIKTTNGIFNSVSNSRVKVESSSYILLSDSRIKNTLSNNNVSDTRIKRAEQQYTVISDTNIVLGQSNELLSNTRVRVTNLYSISLTGSARTVKLNNTFDTLSNATIRRRFIQNKPTDAKILVVQTIDILSNAIILGVKGNLRVLFKKLNKNL